MVGHNEASTASGRAEVRLDSTRNLGLHSQRFHLVEMPTLPDVVPKKSVSGIAVDPKTLDRVIPESRRTDGTYVLRS